MARKTTPARAKEDARPQVGEVDDGGELIRDDKTPVIEAPAVRVVHVEADDAEKKRVAELNDRLEDLEKELKANQRRVEDAERRAADAEALATRHAASATTNQDAAFRNYETSVTNAVTAAKTELAAAKKAYAAAMEAGDFTAAGDAQEAIAKAAHSEQLYAVEQRKIEDYKKNPPKQAEPQRRQPQSPREAVDVRQMPRKARDYLDDHPEYLDDWKLWNRLSRAHADAIDEGNEAYDDEYFAFLDERMGNSRPKRRREPERRERRNDRDEGALPPSRENPSGNRSSRADEVQLTAREVEAAHFSFPELSHHDAEVAYAENKTKLIREDRLGTKH